MLVMNSLKSTVFIYCQANRATGGTELLHQMGYKLNLLGYEAMMVYYGAAPAAENPVAERFLQYNVPYTDSVSDEPENIVIIPETVLGFAWKTRKAKRVLWWLSVDNAPLDQNAMKLIFQDKELIHFCQSFYAMDYVLNELLVDRARVLYLSDFINSIFFVPYDENSIREDVVLFNPEKGFERTSKLIGASDATIKWQSLRGLSPSEMRDCMRNAKVYVDFGNHPGKDRIPREAAMCGLLVVTNRVGSAALSEDVGIDERFRFSEDVQNEQILETIKKLMARYDIAREMYCDYQERIRKELLKFEMDLVCCMDYLVPADSKPVVSSETLLDDMKKSMMQGHLKDAYKSMIEYYRKGFEPSESFFAVSSNIRLSLGEICEALIASEEGIRLYPDSYELFLAKSEALIALNMTDAASEAAFMACKNSIGSADEEEVRKLTAPLIGQT